MRTRDGLSTYMPATSGDAVDLMYCRMAIMGLDPDAIETRDAATFDIIARRCACCDDRDACAVDLQRDPSDPVWEAYCPNSATFNWLSEAWWLTR